MERLCTNVQDNRLTADSATAIACLKNDIDEAMSIIELIKNGKLVAIYYGNREEQYDTNNFLIVTKDQYKKITRKESFEIQKEKMEDIK